MKRSSSVFLALPLFIFLLPNHSMGSVAPTSAGLSLGYSNDLAPGVANWTPVPTLAAAWKIAGHVSIRSSVAYLQERTPRGDQRILSSSGDPAAAFRGGIETLRNHIIPVSAGVRLSAGNDQSRSNGLFVEASPAAYVARIDAETISPRTLLLAGFQLGWGVRILAFDGTHVEIGMNYYRSEAASPVKSRSGWPTGGYEGVNSADIHLTLGLGR